MMADTVCISESILPTQCVIRWSMVYLRAYRSLSPERMQGNGSENSVHLVEHLLAKCKQKEMGSSPTTGAATSKNNPVTQQLRNSAQMVTSAVEKSCQWVKASNHFSTCTDLFLQKNRSLACSVWEYCLPYRYVSGLLCAAEDLLGVQCGRPGKLLLLSCY